VIRLLPDSPVAQVGSIVIRIGARSTKITVVVNRNVGTTENPNGRDFVSVVTQGFAPFAAAQTEETATEARIFVEASTATFPAPAVPIAAGWPSGAGFGIPPAVTISLITIISSARTNEEDRATALLNPQALTINTPGAALNTRRTTDLAVQTDLVRIVAAAVFAIFVVGFAGDALLRRGECGDYEKNKSHSEKAEKRIESHELAPVEFEEQTALSPAGQAEAPQFVWVERSSTERTNLGLTVANGTTVP
jgi:hypothetical protein